VQAEVRTRGNRRKGDCCLHQRKEESSKVEAWTISWAKTYILRPLFNRFLLTDKYFHVDASRCISCGRCQKNCPVGNILIVDDVPQWQSHCAGCLACYHACPYHAINFAGQTQKKGQYSLLRMRNEIMKE